MKQGYKKTKSGKMTYQKASRREARQQERQNKRAFKQNMAAIQADRDKTLSKQTTIREVGTAIAKNIRATGGTVAAGLTSANAAQALTARSVTPAKASGYQDVLNPIIGEDNKRSDGTDADTDASNLLK